MPKVSPLKNNFNGGEFSELLQMRTDIDRFPSAMRSMYNFIAAPQGPAIFRSGTYFQHDAHKHDKYSALLPFVFSDDQANVLEFSDEIMRVLSEDGILVYSNSAVTNILAVTPLQFTSAALAIAGAVVGSQVALAGFPAATNVNGAIVNVTAKSGNDYTVDINYLGATGVPVGSPIASRVFRLVTPYDHLDVRNLRAVQSIDLVYLFCGGYAPQKLQRMSGATSWSIAAVSFIDGPYAPEPINPPLLTPSATGVATEIHTTNIGTNGTASASFENIPAWRAFNDDLDTFWEGSVQTSTLQYHFNSAKIIEGYTIYASRKNDASGASAKGYRPTTWTFEGLTGGVWTVLDEKYDYQLWQNYRTQYISINNNIAYTDYRITVNGLEDHGSFRVRIAKLSLREKGSQTFTLTAGSTAEINLGAGFLATDVGRLMRLYNNDGFWRSVKITARSSTTVVTVALQGDPLLNTAAIRRWRLGAFSDTTGWPTVAGFYEDRMVIGGGLDYPTLIGMSTPQGYETFSPTDPNGTVNDDNGISFQPNTRSASPARWFVENEKGMLVGFGTSEWILKPATDNQAFSARNARAHKSTERGSAAIEPIVIDDQIVFVQKSKRTLRQYAYQFETDGFKAPSMSLFASHLGAVKFEQLVYAAEPHSIVWGRRTDGSVVGLTYNKEENIIGWHRHNFSDGVVESLCVISGGADLEDYVWLVVNRTVNGSTKRYIERLMPFWDFDNVLTDAYFVDCGLRAEFGAPTADVYGLAHLEGKEVVGLADGIKFGPLAVVNGKITLPVAATIVAVGLKYTGRGETVNIEAGAAEGTAQGKVGRMNNISAAVWSSLGGKIGVNNEDTLEDVFTPTMDDAQYRYDELGVPQLFTGILGPLIPEAYYGKRKSIIFTQEDPYPFNVVGLMPQFDTQDRG